MKSNAYHALEVWLAQRPPALACMAIQAATAVDAVLGILRALRSRPGDLKRMGSPPSPRIWLALYRDHRRLCDVLGVSLGMPGPSEEFSPTRLAGDWRRLRDPAFVDEVVQEIRQHPEEVAEWLRAIDGARQELPGVLVEDFRDEIEGREEISDADMRRFFRQPEVQFLFRVWLPCIVEYREYPGRLYRRARLGELDALERLLRLDKAVLHDWMIADHLHQAFHATSRARFQRLAKAISGVSVKRLTKARVKTAMASLIADTSIRMNHQLTEPEVRRLFDLVAKCKGSLRDHELPGRPESLAQAMRRGRGTWRL